MCHLLHMHPAPLHKIFIEAVRMIRRSSVSKAWAVALSAVRVQRKLLTTRISPSTSWSERFVFPFSSSKCGACRSCPPSCPQCSRHPCRRRREGSGIPVRWIPSPVRPHGPTRVLLSVIRLSCFLRRSACTPFSVPADPSINFIFSLLEFPVLTRAKRPTLDRFLQVLPVFFLPFPARGAFLPQHAALPPRPP